MVRAVVAALVAVGCGERDAAWLEALLRTGDRRAVGRHAPARGLYLVAVRYPRARLGVACSGTDTSSSASMASSACTLSEICS